MSRNIARTIFSVVLIMSFALAGCATPAATTPAPQATQPPAAATQPPAAAGKSVGIVLPTKSEPRWLQDQAALQKYMAAAGYQAEILFSDLSSATEKTNAESLITKGVKVIII